VGIKHDDVLLVPTAIGNIIVVVVSIEPIDD
jgi:hypothetical protein